MRARGKRTRRQELLPPDWIRRRRLVLERAGGKCESAGPRCEGIAREVDHIKPLSVGGSNHLDNLRAICQTCHRERSRRATSRDYT